MAKAKITKLDNGIVLSAPADRVRVLFDNRNHAEQKVILYVGFHDFETATQCFNYLIDRGMLSKYSHKTDRGICKPRRAERVDTCEWEIKIHRPDQELVSLFVAKSTVAVEAPKKQTVPVRSVGDAPQWVDPYAE